MPKSESKSTFVDSGIERDKLAATRFQSFEQTIECANSTSLDGLAGRVGAYTAIVLNNRVKSLTYCK